MAKAPVAKSYSSALDVQKGAVLLGLTPAMRTNPLFSRVAGNVPTCPEVTRLPVLVKSPVAGSYSSATVAALALASPPPAMRTCPLSSNVAVRPGDVQGASSSERCGCRVVQFSSGWETQRSGIPSCNSLEEAATLLRTRNTDLIALDDALNGLAHLDPRQSRIVELRFFAGLSIEDTSEILGISPATVKRDWHTACMWLYRDLSKQARACSEV